MWLRRDEQELLLNVLPVLLDRCAEAANWCGKQHPIGQTACAHLRADLKRLLDRIEKREK